jgi:hypothetical protein
VSSDVFLAWLSKTNDTYLGKIILLNIILTVDLFMSAHVIFWDRFIAIFAYLLLSFALLLSHVSLIHLINLSFSQASQNRLIKNKCKINLQGQYNSI